MNTQQNLYDALRVWDWHLAPEPVKNHNCTNGDDVDWLVWVPDHMWDTVMVRSLLEAITVGSWYERFYREEDSQAFLGPDHTGHGFLVTCIH